ncbi:MAG: D-2-hydroxyacid dehydrogenase, partial [Acidobacteria bacterium]|nr:D-2-hydroxyacid dehydrogenase [Acidobacteriota bacterium]
WKADLYRRLWLGRGDAEELPPGWVHLPRAIEVEWVRGKTLGIVGYGAIGRAIVDRLHPFGMHILALRRDLAKAAEDPRIDQVYPPQALHQMLPQCDYLVVATPLTPETLGMIGEKELALLPPHAVLINVGRGAVIDEPALIATLEQQRIQGAVLDVFSEEPLPAGHPFYRLKNVLLSPHVADHTPEWADLAMEFFLKNFERYQQGLPLENMVDKDRGY